MPKDTYWIVIYKTSILFVELHKFLFSYNIELTHDEWIEYRDRFFRIISKKNNLGEVINVDFSNIIMPIGI